VPYVVSIQANIIHSFANIGTKTINVIDIFPRNTEAEIDPEAKQLAANNQLKPSAKGRLQQLIRIDIDGDSDIFWKGKFVECFADETAQAHDGFATDQDVKTELAL
jgi:hypothetical protein